MKNICSADADRGWPWAWAGWRRRGHTKGGHNGSSRERINVGTVTFASLSLFVWMILTISLSLSVYLATSIKFLIWSLQRDCLQNLNLQCPFGVTQYFHFLLQRSEFESCWSLQFFSNILAGVGPLFQPPKMTGFVDQWTLLAPEIPRTKPVSLNVFLDHFILFLSIKKSSLRIANQVNPGLNIKADCAFNRTASTVIFNLFIHLLLSCVLPSSRFPECNASSYI